MILSLAVYAFPPKFLFIQVTNQGGATYSGEDEHLITQRILFSGF